MDKGRETGRNHLILFGIVLAVAVVVAAAVVWMQWHQEKTRTFYEGSSINNVNVSGLTADEAYKALQVAAQKYEMTVTFFDGEHQLSAEQLGLSIGDKKLVRQALKEAHRAGEDSSAVYAMTVEGLYSCDTKAISSAISDWTELTSCAGKTSKDAKLVYNEEAGSFEIQKEQAGGTVDTQALAEAIGEQAGVLCENFNVMESGLYGQVIRSEAGEQMQNALLNANKRLNLDIVYHYDVKSGSGEELKGDEEIGYDLLSKWLYVDSDGITVLVDSDALQNYCTLMYDTYSIKSGSQSQFVTTSGSFVDVDVPAADETVDADALYKDILECVDNMTDGEREAPYASTSVGISGTTNLGGSYVEVDLDAQHLWLYCDGELVVDGDICSGDVATGCATPGGLYTINSMETDRWLNGPTWHDWVSYWMPFNGGIGLHDATWRSTEDFGGDVYLESGSHGCINMPLELAKEVFDHVDVGYYVILYGGTAASVNQPQTITGTSSYSKKTGDAPFYLDAKATGNSVLSYSSSNNNVVTVNSEGKVTIVGGGTATIRVYASATDMYTDAVKNITINVSGKKKTSTTQSSQKNSSSTTKKDTSKEDTSKNSNSSSKPSGSGSGSGSSGSSSGDSSGGSPGSSGSGSGSGSGSDSGSSSGSGSGSDSGSGSSGGSDSGNSGGSSGGSDSGSSDSGSGSGGGSDSGSSGGGSDSGGDGSSGGSDSGSGGGSDSGNSGGSDSSNSGGTSSASDGSEE